MYKRQTLLREKEAEEEARRLEKEIEKDVRMEEKEITSVEDVEELLTPMEIDKPTPVSYTHLDVYKRQT